MAGVAADASSRVRPLLQELAVRAGVSVLILGFNELFSVGPHGPGDASLRTLATIALALNVPYYLIARTGWRLRLQAYVRMLMDITLVTAGLYDAGGIAAAQDLAVYVIVPVYAALMLSSTASLVGTAYATLSYLAVVGAQSADWLPMSRPPLPDAGGIVAFNLLVVNVVGVMTAWLAERYRRSRREVRTLYREVERAHDAAQRLTGEIQRSARLYALGEVVAGITHELRNVLMAAGSHNHLLRRRLVDADPEIKRHADQIDHGLTTAARILNNVLETARQPSSERIRVAPADVVTGTGLGLAISAGIVRDAGGDLTAANRSEGGAVFRIVLPMTP